MQLRFFRPLPFGPRRGFAQDGRIISLQLNFVMMNGKFVTYMAVLVQNYAIVRPPPIVEPSRRQFLESP
eukprot:scaffold18498_cov186-Amphora_coffeaeformis.AAC.10